MKTKKLIMLITFLIMVTLMGACTPISNECCANKPSVNENEVIISIDILEGKIHYMVYEKNKTISMKTLYFYCKEHILINEDSTKQPPIYLYYFDEDGNYNVFDYNKAITENILLEKPKYRRNMGDVYDPIEDTDFFKEILPELEQKLDDFFASDDREFGFCHSYWSKKREILLNDYNIVWSSPAILNPNIMYD